VVVELMGRRKILWRWNGKMVDGAEDGMEENGEAGLIERQQGWRVFMYGSVSCLLPT
jgi:hypothetical protein